MFSLRISVPTYDRNSFKKLEVFGEIVISADSDNLIESYDRLKFQVDELLKQVNFENQMVVDFQKLQSQIEDKQSVLSVLNTQIERARRQFERLRNFLARFGIDASSNQMFVSDDVQQQLRLVSALVDTAVVDTDDDGLPEF